MQVWEKDVDLIVELVENMCTPTTIRQVVASSLYNAYKDGREVERHKMRDFVKRATDEISDQYKPLLQEIWKIVNEEK